MRGFSSAYSVQMLIVTAGHNSDNQSPCVVAAFHWTHENRQRVFHLKRNCVDAQHIKLRKYGPCRFSFQSVKQRPTGLFAIVISSSSPRLDWVHTGKNDSDSVAMSRAKSPHLSQLTCPLLDLNWNDFVNAHSNNGWQRNKWSEKAQTCFYMFFSLYLHFDTCMWTYGLADHAV